MNLQPQWQNLLARLDATDAVRNFAGACQLVRVGGNTMHLETNQAFSRSAADKLVRAIADALGVPVAINVRRLPGWTGIRFYCEPKRKSA